MSKRSVVFLIETLNRGGVENMLLRVIPYLSKEEWHSVVMTIGRGGEMLAEYRAAGVEVVELKQTSIFRPVTVRAINRQLHQLNPDLIVTTLIRADLIGRLTVAPFTRTPVASYTGTTYNHSRYWPARLFEWITRPLAYHYIANSEAVKEFYIHHLGVQEEKISVVANGLNIRQFQQADVTSVAKELGLPQNSFVVTCVGNLAPNKGQNYLIDAFDAVFADNPRATLLLVGEGEMRDTLEAQRKSLRSKDRIHLLGRRTDVPSILGITDVFAFPTLFEGMSVALMEAMAAGNAIVTTDIPENKVLVSANETALLVPPQNVEKLARALELLYKDGALRGRLGKSALRVVSNRYSIERCAKKFADAFQKICQKT